MFFWNKICVIATFFLISSGAANAQNSRVKFFNNKYSVNNDSVKNSPALISLTSANLPPENVMIRNQAIRRGTVPLDFYATRLPFFCRQELKIQKASGLPIFLRLGSLKQCNYYEGKN